MLQVTNTQDASSFCEKILQAVSAEVGTLDMGTAAALPMQFPTRSVNLPRWASLRLLTLLVLSVNVAFSGSIVKYLPGFDGELPFKLETGYISVGDSELFYYFIESEGNPQEDPLFLWLTGGPGCSSFSGLVYEIGPLEFDINNYLGGVPKLVYYPYAWTKTASIIFVDAPVGTGFSYSRTAAGWPTSDSESAEQSYQFLRKWLEEHPQYLRVQLFIGGDSYSGITVPLVTKKVVEGNAAKVPPRLNLKGYLVGSPHTDSIIDENSKIVFSHRMGLISDELYEQLKTSCNESYVNVEPSNTACVLALEYYQKCVKDIWSNCILEPNCVFASPKVNSELHRRSLEEKPTEFILSPPRIPEYWCRNFNYVLAYIWSNDDGVRDALHIRQSTVLDWKRCNMTLSYTKDILSVVDVHRFLSTLDLTVLVESGDRDKVVPFVGTVKWIKSLNLTIDVDWRPWLVDGQIAGYTVKYSRNDAFRLTYATVKGAGHTAPEYFRRECYYMFQRWVHYYPFGDRDMVVPFVGTVKWIKSLNWTIDVDWRPWLVDGQIAGYTVKYSRDDAFSLTYATVKGAGHTAPEYFRRECYHMFQRWVHYYPL